MRIRNKTLLLYIFLVFFIAKCNNGEQEKPTTLEAIKQISMLKDSTFFGVVTEMKYQNNSIYLLDNTPQILQINPKFELKKRIHNIGKGPGQFTGILDLSYSNDSLYVCDKEQAKVLVYDRNSTFARDFNIGENATGNDMAVNGSSYIYLNLPFNKSPVSTFDAQGNLMNSFGRASASNESFNALRNWRLLLAKDQKLIAISKSDPFIKVYKSNGELLSETEIRHPILEDRIAQIKKSYETPSVQGGYRLVVLIDDADIFDNKLYLLAVTDANENNEPNFTFVLSYEIKRNGNLVNRKTYKLYRKDHGKELDGLSLVVLRNNKMVVFDRSTGSLWLFRDETI